nr:hypothetical protein [Mycobacteroides abscessus]
MDVVVDGVAAVAALTEDLPVFEAGDDVFDAGAVASVCLVVGVVDDASVGSAARTGDGGNAAVSAVAQDRSGAVEEVGDGVAGDDDVVAVAGPGLSRQRSLPDYPRR